jgi:hypothetical protein
MEYTIVKSINITPFTTSSTALICPYSSDSGTDVNTPNQKVCMAFDSSNHVVAINIATELVGMAPTVDRYMPDDLDYNYNGVDESPSSVWLPMSIQGFVPFIVTCRLVNSATINLGCQILSGYDSDFSTGNIPGESTSYLRWAGTGTAGYYPTGINEEHSFFAKLGTQYKLFVTLNYESTHYQTAAIMQHDTLRVSDAYTGNEDYNIMVNSTDNEPQKRVHSNWAVADYNKDGLNEACYLTTLSLSVLIHSCKKLKLT